MANVKRGEHGKTLGSLNMTVASACRVGATV